MNPSHCPPSRTLVPAVVEIPVKPRRAFGLLSRVSGFHLLAAFLLPVPQGHAESPLVLTNITRLDFRASRQLWDPARASVLVSDPTLGRVLRVSLADGAVTASWTAPAGRTPEALAISPDGHRVAASLVTGSHDRPLFQKTPGFIAFLDAETLAEDHTLALQSDPWDVAILDDGTAVVGGGLTTVGGVPMGGGILLYPAGSGTATSYIYALDRNFLAPVPGTTRVYADSASIPPERFGRFDFRPALQPTSLAWATNSSSAGDLPTIRPALRAGNGMMLRPNGDVLSLSDDPNADLRLVGHVAHDHFGAAAWDPAAPVLVGVSSTGPQCFVYNADTLLLISSPATDRALEDAGVVGGNLYGTLRDANHTWIVRVPYSGSGITTNAPPSADFSWQSSPTIDTPLRAAVGGEQDDGGPLGLSYAWDFDGDGIADGPYTTNRVAFHAFLSTGLHPVTLFVRDYWGATNSASHSVGIGESTNTPPVARFTWSPASVATGEAIEFDARASTDDQLPSIALSVRWDWDGDGVFDTAATNKATTAHLFRLAGPRQVTLEVRDLHGAANTATHLIDVVQRPDTGSPMASQPAFDLPFRAAAMWVDSARSRAYFTDPAGRRLVRVPLDTGRPDRQWWFDFPTDTLVATADGSRLYIGEIARPRVPFLPQGESGRVAVFDPVLGAVLNEFSTDIDPGQLLPVGNDLLLITSGTGSGQEGDGNLESFAVPDGRKLGTIPVPRQSPLLSRGIGHVLALNGNFVIQRDVAPDGTLADPSIDSLGTVEYVQGPWAMSPSGNAILTAGGFLFDVPADPSLPVVPNGLLPLWHDLNPYGPVVFDDESRHSVFLGSSKQVIRLETAHWTQMNSIGAASFIQFLGFWKDRLVVAGDGGSGTLVETPANPVAGLETNRPPVARLMASTNSVAMGKEVRFDASATTDDSTAPSALEYRWDWNGDQIFDTAFATNSAAVHRYFFPGSYVARVEVRDQFGVTAQSGVSIKVAAVPDPGQPGMTNVPFQLPYHADGLAFEGPRHRVYVANSNAKFIAEIDLDTGLEVRRWQLNRSPGHMVATPDLKHLYIAIHSEIVRSGEFPSGGFVAELDLGNDTIDRWIPVIGDPWDLVATDDGILVVALGPTGGSGTYSIDTYRLADKTRTGSLAGRNSPTLRLDPEQAAVWLTTTDSGPQQFIRLGIVRPQGTLDAESQLSTGVSEDSPMLPLPGNRVLAPDGAVHSGSSYADILASPKSPMVVLDGLVLSGNQWLVAATGTGIRYLNLDSLAWLDWSGAAAFQSYSGPAPQCPFGAVGTNHVVATTAASLTTFQFRDPPAVLPDKNRMPTVVWIPPFPTAVAVPGKAKLSFATADLDGQVVSLELRAGNTTIGTLDPASGKTTVNLPASTTNFYTLVATDNLGAVTVSDALRVVGSAPPALAWRLPAVPAVPSGQPFDVGVDATDAEGQIQRVEFNVRVGKGSNLLAVVTAPPWQATVAGIDADSTLEAYAYDDQGLRSAASQLAVHAIGAEGDDSYRSFQLSGSTATDLRSNATATKQTLDPMPPIGLSGRTLWWRWTAPSNGIVIVSTAGTTADTVLVVSKPGPFGGFQTLASNDDSPGSGPTSRAKFRAEAGTEYLVTTDTYPGTGSDVAIGVAYTDTTPLLQNPEASPPPNDAFANRIAIDPNHPLVSVDTTGATRQPGEPTFFASSNSRTVWWDWTAPSDGSATFATAGSAFDTVLGVYTNRATDLQFMIELGTNDDVSPDDNSSRVSIPVVAGNHYLVVVDSFGGNGGLAKLSVAFDSAINAPRPPNDDFADATAISLERESLDGTTVGAGIEPGEIVGSGGPNSVWWKWIAPHGAQVVVVVEPAAAAATVWTGASVSNVVEVSYRSGPAIPGKKVFNAVAGATYFLRIAPPVPTDFHGYISATLPRIANRSVALAPLPDGRLGVRYSGTVVAPGVLQASPNLEDWYDVLVRTWTPGEQVAVPTDDWDGLFYRLLLDR